MNTVIWFVGQSLTLDVRFLVENYWPPAKKIKFLITKYFLIVKHVFMPFRLAGDYCTLNGKLLYYDSKYGLAGLQRAMVSHAHLLRYIGNKKIGYVLDVGANVGYFSYLIHDLYPKAIIHAFEPIPQTFECLKNNFSYSDNVIVNNCAITDKQEMRKMLFDTENSAESHIDQRGTIQVKTQSIDSYIRKHGIKAVDILKIDTEGFEDAVLDGAQRTLSVTDYIYMEVSIEHNNRYTITQLLSKLYTNKYNFQLVAMRNFSDRSEGYVPIMDCLFVNIKRVTK